MLCWLARESAAEGTRLDADQIRLPSCRNRRLCFACVGPIIPVSLLLLLLLLSLLLWLLSLLSLLSLW